MPVVDRFMVQVFRRRKSGELIGDDPIQTSSPEEAIAKARKYENRVPGVLAYSWKGDMRTGEVGKLIVLMRCGVLPLHVLEQVYSAVAPY